MGVIRQFAVIAFAAMVLTPCAVAIWTALWPLAPAETVKPADVILCLGAGIAQDGKMHTPTQNRVESCAELYLAGKAPVIVMSAGSHPSGDIPGAVAMAAHAQAMGVPDKAIRQETRAQSTLQNALFARELVPAAKHALIVTEAFHLPRSWASHRWAGFDRVTLHASERIRRSNRAKMILRETAAIWFNAGRAIAYSAGAVLGVDASERVEWLH